MMTKDEFDYEITFEESYEYVPGRESPYVIIGDEIADFGIDGKETNSESSD